MSEVQIEVRRATLADKNAIFEFLEQAYSGRARFKFPQRWEWAYERNPFTDGQLPVWIAVVAGRVVGQSAALVEPLVVDGRRYRLGWGVDFYVLPEYRGRGLGTRLQAANNASHEVFMSLSMAAGAARIKETLGLQPLPEVGVFTRIQRHDPDSVLKTLAGRVPLLPPVLVRRMGLHRRVAEWLTARARREEAGFQDERDDSLQIESLETFGDHSAALWARLGSRYRALVRRQAGYLNWKFAEQPHMEHARFMAYRVSVPVGHLVLRRARPPERNAGIIADLFCDPADEPAARGLLLLALAWFRDRGVTYVQAAASAPFLKRLYLSLGFKQTAARTPLARSDFQLPQDGWLLGKGDHDWDQYPLA